MSTQVTTYEKVLQQIQAIYNSASKGVMANQHGLLVYLEHLAFPRQAISLSHIYVAGLMQIIYLKSKKYSVTYL